LKPIDFLLLDKEKDAPFIGPAGAPLTIAMPSRRDAGAERCSGF
jgi:hypothetical protein